MERYLEPHQARQDPMHVTYLHKQSHSMSEGGISATCKIRDSTVSCLRRKASAT